MVRDTKSILSNFQLGGRLVEVIPYGTGHINDTYASRVECGGQEVRYIHQRINGRIFKQPERVMENIVLVTGHLQEKIREAGGDPGRETLTLVPALDGKVFHVDGDGAYWRTYRFIDGARTYDTVEDLAHVRHAAQAFGRFQTLVSDLPAGDLHETIPNFHNTRSRFADFNKALQADPLNRAAGAPEEVRFVLDREADASVLIELLESGQMPGRITHNDTKLNNVMIDDKTGQGICVIDLDTVMPGLAVYDFGDSVRIGASSAAEDEQDLSKVTTDLRMFGLLVEGYLGAVRDCLTPLEVDHLVFAAKLMTFECGMRFLADHLAGDTYFKVHRENHNLDRCRTQFKMVRVMEERRDELEAIVARHRG